MVSFKNRCYYFRFINTDEGCTEDRTSDYQIILETMSETKALRYAKSIARLEKK